MNEKITFKVSYNPENGNILGFFPSNIKYTNIPEPNIEIDEVKYQMCMEKNVKVENNDIVEIVPTIEEILQKKKETNLNELNIAYEQAQYIKIESKHDFLIPLKGEYFKVDIKKQHDLAQDYGSANLIGIDVNGAPQMIPNIPKEMWSNFYVTANTISEGNYSLKLQYQYNIDQTQTIEELDNIVITFPPIQTIIINL